MNCTPRATTKSLVRRVALCVVAMTWLMAGVAVTTGHTAGLLGASTVSSSNSFSSGSVSLTSVAGGSCAATNLLPGTTSPACTLSTTYAGSAPAFVALDVVIETQSGNGGTNLYNPADAAHDLQVSITSTSPSATYVVPTVATTCPGSAPTGSTCYALSDEIVATTPLTSSSPAVVFSTVLSLPASATSGYRGGAAQILESVHATQATNNGVTSSCTVGHQCDSTSPGTTAPSWS